MPHAKRKGKVGELQVASLLRSYGFEARRGQQYKGTEDSPDVIGLPGHHVEVKRRERWKIRQWLTKCEEEAPQDTVPILFVRENRGEWVVVLDAHDYLALMKEVEDGIDDQG